ncbi:flagellar biosynthesis protein FlhF [Clostridium saccharoperbutylacetonicum]|uniref:flagellar biosynthesis protein FlhF n=1 Tax=Clostridium saccharoperbutylacetonicum TaxID=36745 RepID=UPI000983A201|nr:flagellar biosynthesis protein FlhF [Clostridium saccharoperbutylacetonicum]AQR96944.1 flagellar biosynthesis protein FlhF [Clostridium saccharoperbutylacetonicum]NSB32823.1 flagellar biosynthesis protein FlhF [Clostridium saccharoperbutylacetonicum]
MIIKKYLVKDMNEGLTRIRYELGKDAIIISQRKVRRPGIIGLLSKKLIEVTAAVENSTDQEKDNRSFKQDKNYYKQKDEEEEFRNSLESIKKLMQNEMLSSNSNNIIKEEVKAETLFDKILEHNTNVEKETAKSKEENIPQINKVDKLQTKAVKSNDEENSSMESIHKEVTELKDLLNKVIKTGTYGEISENLLQERLKNLDIDEALQDDILSVAETMKTEDIDEIEILRDVFERDILVARQNLTGRVVLVGPTGVGKTTTIAKLAGRLALVEKKKVGLITVDTYRIGAIEQLKTYAEIMNIPFKVVITMKEMEEAIEAMKECDVILIDTTGRSSKNAMQISELRAFVQKANPDHVDMVISATTKNSDIKSILKGYAELDFDNIIITKLDETTVYGSLYNIAKLSNKPVSFITIGQNVPDDILVPTKEKIASFILGEEIIC